MGDLQARTQRAAQKFFPALSERQRDLYMVSRRYLRSAQRQDYRNGYYSRDFVTKFGTLRLRVPKNTLASDKLLKDFIFRYSGHNSYAA